MATFEAFIYLAAGALIGWAVRDVAFIWRNRRRKVKGDAPTGGPWIAPKRRRR